MLFQANIFDALRLKVAPRDSSESKRQRHGHTFPRVLQRIAASGLVTGVMASANPLTDWSLLSTLLRLAQRDGWNISFGKELVLVVHRRAARGVLVLPAALLGHARGAGWRVARRPWGFELHHPAVRHRIEVRVAAA